MRRSRLNYTIRLIPTYLLAMIFVSVGKPMREEGLMLIASVLISLGVVCTIYVVYISIGRLKDMNANPWWAVLSIIPLISLIFFIALMFLKGTEGENQYGKDPLTKKLNSTSKESE